MHFNHHRLRSLVILGFLLSQAISGRAIADDITVMLDWFINPDHAPLLVAQEAGYFKDVGLKVTFEEPANAALPPKMVASGNVDLAISYQPDLYLQIAAGLPIRRIATLIATPLTCILVRADGPIRTIKDLKGRKVGYAVSGLQEALMKAVLAHHDMIPEDIEMINVGFGITPALLTNKVDAVMGAFRNFELTQMRLAGGEGRAFFLEDEGIPSYDELIILAHVDRLSEPWIQGFIQALELAIHDLVNRPKVSLSMITKAYKALNDELGRTAFNDTLRRFALRPAALDYHRYKRFADFMAKLKMIPKALPVSAYAVDPGALNLEK